MLAKLVYQKKEYQFDLSKPIDISIPLSDKKENVSAWYVQTPIFKAVETDDWIGDVNKGGSVNFRTIFFNPHGNGTHTECVGHISKENYTINQCLKRYFFMAELISIKPEEIGNGDLIITKKQIEELLTNFSAEALVIRTLPNELEKMKHQYSNTNPPYITEEAMELIYKKGITHLLIDLPSVDKEKDDGKLLAHRMFWQYPKNTRLDCTITELIFVPNDIVDGRYLLNLQIASFETDASPSKPVLYKMNS